MSILKEGKPVGLACDHAGYEMKQIVMQELMFEVSHIRISGHIRQIVATIPISHILWLWLWKRVNVIRVSLFAVVGMV